MFKQKKAVFIAMAAALLVCSIISADSFFTRADAVRTEILRLHVMANSNSAEDQELKLQVRDALLQAGGNMFDGTMDVNNAHERLADNVDVLQSAGEEAIHSSGRDYALSIIITEEYFNTRSYGDITLPAGRYAAVKAVIGEGEGQNWWCVMFPPLCLPAAQAEPDEFFDASSLELIESDPRVEVRFKLVEWMETLRDRWF